MLAVLGRMDPFARLRKQGLAGGRSTGRSRRARRSSSPSTAPTSRATTSAAWTGTSTARPTATTCASTRRRTGLRATVFLDTSGSMAYTGERAAVENGAPLSKLDYARHLTAALAWLFLRNQDLCGLVTAADEMQVRLPAANALRSSGASSTS
ncbi:MAG: hypothetical protein U1G05_04960 [Kiritimatiellia bacterium]